MCYIIGSLTVSEPTFNSKLTELFGAERVDVPTDEVHDTIEEKLQILRSNGRNPYFIPGGGHGNIGTEAYVQCYREIKTYEKTQNINFDYIFLASGTGTTQAGLVCGQLMSNDDRKIIGISIARKNPRGRDVVIESVRDYLLEKKAQISEASIQRATIFLDEYIGDSYGRANEYVASTLREVMCQYGVPLDSTYTGKAFYGMIQHIKSKGIRKKNILFIHTGGTPLFFDDLQSFLF